MAAAKSLPARPSLEALRKHAKKLARERSVSLRDAQFMLAREYGFAGWQDLIAEVHKRLRNDVEWAAAQARRVIHDNDVAGLKNLLREYPALLSWQGDDQRAGLLGFATGAYGDAFDPQREQLFTRAACAELLIDTGAVVAPCVCEGLLHSRARGLLQLFKDRGLLPQTLKFHSALGDFEQVEAMLGISGNDLAPINDAFIVACAFEHEAIASLLLDRSIALDPNLGTRIDASVGRDTFVKYFVDNRPPHATEAGLWKAFVIEQVNRAISSWSGHRTSATSPIGHSDLTAFVRLLQREPWLLGESSIEFQAEIIERATLNDGERFITALLDLDPAILRRQPPPPSQAIEFAFTYGKTRLIPLLTRIWPVPDDLPHAAGMGNLSRVMQWFDESGVPMLGNLEHHYPCSPYMPKGRVDEYAHQWGGHSVQRILDSALAWSLINRHLDVADFLLEHGANINTTWSSHEPASILHELVFHANYESMQFLIDRGIDMTIKDYRWNATAQGWALHAAKDETMAEWLEKAERRREQRQ